RRHLRTQLLGEFQLRRREKFLYTHDFLDLWEWEIRVLDIEPGSPGAWQAGRQRHRKRAAVRAGTCDLGSAQVLSAHGRAGAGREGRAAHGRSAAGTGSSRPAKGAARSGTAEGRTTAQRIRAISTGSFQPAGGQ